MLFRLNHLGRIAVAVVAALGTGGAWAQTPGSTDAGYPYRGSAPSSFSGSRVTTPAPMISPSTVSNAARSSPAPGANSSSGLGSGIGGGYLPPFLTAFDTGSRLPTNTAPDSKAHIWLRVPANAQVWVDGSRTRQTGEARHFYSPPLTPGKKYAYEIRVRWTEDGKPVEKNQRIVVQAGSIIRQNWMQQGDKETSSSSKTSARKQ